MRMMLPATTPPACRAPYLFAQMRSATGKNNWDGISQTTAYGRILIAGLHGSAQFDDDLARGRYARRIQAPVAGRSAEVYDGSTIWAQDFSGGVHPYDAPFARERAITAAYLTSRGYFDQGNKATFTCLGARTEHGQAVTVVRVQPRGGIPADLAIDTKTYLLLRVSERFPIALDDSVTTYGDYRSIDGVVLPFSISLGTNADPGDGYAVQVSRYQIKRHAQDAAFEKPTSANDVRMVGGVTSTTVPMMLEGRQLMIWASINGHPPMPFILDTGGHAILTALAAKTLGLSGHGTGESGGAGSGTISTQYTRVKSVRVGNALVRNQPFLVIPYPYSFYERGKKTPLAGIIGLEFFERFATRLDYGDRTVTLTPLSGFHYRGPGTHVSFTFQDDMPMVDAAADGHAGLFGVDTGNAGSLILFGDFLTRTGVLANYPAGISAVGHGTGGTNTGRFETLREFSIGGHGFRDVTTDFTQMTSGAFSSWTEAGNMGFSILSRFIPTFDYANQILYLDPEKRATPFGKNRSGIGFEKNEPGAFVIDQVKPGSIAAADGIVSGDRIVAVNGKDPSNYSTADLEAIVMQRAGTQVHLRIQHADAVRDVTIVLR
jgi:hypothetical protein